MAVASGSPARNVPHSRTMESSSTNPGLIPEIASDSSSAGDPSDRLNRSLSLPGEGDLLSSSKSEEYRLLFRLPPEEVLIQDFNCALQESILLQGHMYLFDRHICFYSNIFGFETKKIIPLHEVTSVRRAKTAGLFSNAIEIMAAGKKHFFASFLSRDEAFKLIHERLSQQGNGVGEVADQQDSKSETSNELNGAISTEEVRSSEPLVSDLDSDARVQTESKVGYEKPFQNITDDDNGASTSEVRDVMEEDREVVVDEDLPTHLSPVKWEEETQDAPEIPQHYTKVAESKFLIKVEDFFNLFFSDDAIVFLESFRIKCGDKDFKCLKWHRHEDYGHAREMSFQHPIKVYFGAKCGGCKEFQTYRIYRNSHLVIRTSQEVSDVPYADYFQVKGLWDVEPIRDQSKEGCVLRVFVHVSFSKKTMWKGKIEQSTIEECREAFTTWIDLAHEVLKQKNLEKLEGVKNVSKNGEALLESSKGDAESSERENDPTILNDIPPVRQSSCGQTDISIQENLFDIALIASLLRANLDKLCTHLKSPGNLQRLLLILFAVIILLMQLSIVVLLSRPNQVYVIPQADPAHTMGLGSRQVGQEAIADWLEKRIHLLKDDMLVVEVQLERMRHEQILLRAQLESFKTSSEKQQ